MTEAIAATPEICENKQAILDEIIATNRDRPGAMMVILNEIQKRVGYVSEPMQRHVAGKLRVPVSAVHGVVTFYSFFSMTPKGRHTIKLCLGTACYVKGIKEVMSRVENQYKIKAGGTTGDRRFSLQGVRCLGACGLAPVMVVDQDTHGAVSADQIIDILAKYE